MIKIKIIIELLKFICFTGFIVNIFGDSLGNLLFYGVTTILIIVLKEVVGDDR